MKIDSQKQPVALVSGGTGFIGSHLVRKLIREGWAVVVLSRESSNLSQLGQVKGNIQICTHDGSSEHLVKIVREAAPTVVFHLASLFLPQHGPEHIEGLIRSNVLFGTQLVEAMCQAGCLKLINAGTSWQHFESKSYSPVCLYAATKQAFEAILQFYLETTPLQAITLKLFDTYGPDDPRKKLFALLQRAVESGEHVMMSPGEQLLNLVHIDDVTEAFRVAAARLCDRSDIKYESFGIASDRPIRLRDLVDIYSKSIGRRVQAQWGARPYRSREVFVPWSNPPRLPGWEPKIALADGLKTLREVEPMRA